jgi:hypothetical protein
MSFASGGGGGLGVELIVVYTMDSTVGKAHRSWDDILELLGLKIDWDVATAFMMLACIDSFAVRLSKQRHDSNHDDNVPVCHIGYFFIFNSFDYIIF